MSPARFPLWRAAVRLAPASCATVALVGCSAPNPRLVFADPQFGFILVIPDSGWVFSEETGMRQVLVIAKAESSVGGFTPNVTIAVEPVFRMITARKYLSQGIDALKREGFVIGIPMTRVVNHMEYAEVRGRCDSCEPPIIMLMRAVVKDRHAFVATCTVPEGHPDLLIACTAVIDSWRFR